MSKYNSGVYKITNCITKQLYIGSSNNLKEVRKKIFYDLKNNNYSNNYLQQAFNRYGEDNFIFKVIRYNKDGSDLFEMKQFWLDKYFDNHNKCYNIYSDAKGTKGIKRSKEVREKIRQGKLNNKNKLINKKKKNGDILYELLSILPIGTYKKNYLAKQLNISDKSTIYRYLKYHKIVGLINKGCIIVNHHSVDKLIDFDIEISKKHKKTSIKKINFEEEEINYCVYKFIDINNNILYIGKTKNLKNRINEHFGCNGHLDKECYDSINKILYIELDNRDEMSIYERYLINKFSPIYNKQYNNNSKFNFELPELDWEEYDRN